MNVFILALTIWSCLIATPISGNYWSDWTKWSQCSRTCDGGAKYQTRKCVRSRVYNFKCRGRAIRYSTCKNEPCPAGLPDFRSEQCAAYNDASYSGRYFRWLPYHNPAETCALSCIAEGTNMVAILAPKVLDGTRCNTHSLDMCINGRCLVFFSKWVIYCAPGHNEVGGIPRCEPVGCDHKLESSKVMDACGICDGNNSTCSHSNRGVAGRYRWIETGYSSCSVTCGVGVKEKRLLCFDTYPGKVMDSTYCDNLIRPAESRKACSAGACPPEWRVGPWQNCTRDCGGGVSWRIVTCVKTFKDGTQQLVRDSFCKKARPSARKSCNGYICPTWYAGEWSVCSVSCGTGTQRREIICRHIGNKFCRAGDKPRVMKNCTTGIPCYNLNDNRYTGRRLIGDIQERNVGEFQASYDGGRPQGDQAITKEDLYTPRFVTTTWDTCSASCGAGTRFRFVRCQVYLQYLEDFIDLPDEDCKEEKPQEYEPCMIEPCYDQYEWVPVGMTECSQTCLGGIQETILQCKHRENETAVEDMFCLEAPHVQTERRICNDRPCPQRWDLGTFGECSKTCGGGTMSRTVKCIQEFAQGPNILTLPDFMCSQPVPERVSMCNSHDCPANWTVGNWSECSVTCGNGLISRLPLCQRMRDGSIVNVTRSECDITLKPDTEKPCNRSACPEPMIKTKDVTFFQLNKITRLKLVVGMRAALLPDTTVILKCPNVGLDRQKITWFKNGYKVKRKRRSRTRVSKSGALRVKHLRPGRDNGTYTCLIGGLRANVSITFSSSFEILQATLNREKYLKQTLPSSDNLMNGTILHKDIVDRKLKPLFLWATGWSRCSVTCGGGLQSRELSCEIITRNYYEDLRDNECLKHLKVKPLTIQSCSKNPCVKWQPGDWSECSRDGCVRNLYSIQRRSVNCVNEFNDSIADDKLCSESGFPPDNVRDCFNSNCTARWDTSKWSKCLSECDAVGFKTRMLNCIWTSNGQLAPPGSCNMLVQPRAVRKCKGKKCSKMVCKDESDRCSIIKIVNMCHIPSYADRCCRTCSLDYDYDDDNGGDNDDDASTS